jgi:hypothetical protein
MAGHSDLLRDTNGELASRDSDPWSNTGVHLLILLKGLEKRITFAQTQQAPVR